MADWSFEQWCLFGLMAFIALVAIFYWEENLRGKWAWENYKREMAAQGRSLDWAAHISPPVPLASNVFAAPNMGAWFTKQGGLGGMSVGLPPLGSFNQEAHSNVMAEITVVPLATEVSTNYETLVLEYRPPYLSFAASKSPTNGPADTVIPVIVMDQVPLVDAIKYLTRQYGLKYTYDPKVRAQYNADGTPLMASLVSFKWENLTAHQALLAVLANYNLQLTRNPKTGVTYIGPKDSEVQTDPDLQERLKQIVEDSLSAETNIPAGPSLMGAQLFLIHLNPLPRREPVKIILKADQLPRTDELTGFFSKNLRYGGSGGRYAHVAPSGTNTFTAWMGPITHITAADYLAWSDKYQSEFELIREGLERPYARMDGSYEVPARMPVPNFINVRILAQTLDQRAKSYLLLGQPEQALRELTTINHLCRMLEGRPSGKSTTLIAAMINVAVRSIYVDVISSGLQLQAWREPQLTAIQKQLEDVDLLPCLARGFEVERVASCHTLEYTTPEEYLAMNKTAPVPRFADRLKDPIYTFRTFAPQGWLYQNLVSISRMDQGMLDCIDAHSQLVSASQMDAAIHKLDVNGGRLRPFSFLATHIVPNYTRALLTASHIQTLVNEALIVCALERYQLANGHYPETLETLQPQFIQELPHDLIGGKPLKYHAEKDRFSLYSIGWNAKDDGGLPSAKMGHSISYESNDWVWPFREQIFK